MKTQIKKLLSILTLIAILATAFYTVPTTAATTSIYDENVKISKNGNWVYVFLCDYFYGTCQDEPCNKDIAIVNYRGNETEIVIPETVDGHTVIGVGDFYLNGYPEDELLLTLFNDDAKITKVSIPKTVTAIGTVYYDSFFGSRCDCDTEGECGCVGDIDTFFIKKRNLSSSSIFNRNITEFAIDENNPYYTTENGVIYNKDKTELILYPAGKTDEVFTLPESVKSFGDCAFAYSKLKRVENFDNVTELPSYLFAYSNIETFTAQNINIITDYAFYNCTALKSINTYKSESEFYPNQLSAERIGCRAFYNCTSLESLNLNGAVEIEEYAFENCTALKEVTLPKNISSIGNIFYGCESIVNYSIDENNPYYTTENGIIYNKDKTELVLYPAGKTDEVFTLPENVKSFSNYAFAYSKLKRVENFDNVTELSKYLFAYSSIEEFPKMENINEISNYAFAYCNNLKNVIIDPIVNSIGSHAFYSCKNLETVNFGKILWVGNAAFAQCSKLKEVNLPQTCYKIGDYAFSNCKSLEIFTTPYIEQIGEYAFYKCISLKQINSNYRLCAESIYTRAFYKCSSLEKIKLSIEYRISEYAFEDCTALKKVSFVGGDIPDRIEENPFKNTALVNEHKEGVVYIGYDVALCYKAPKKAATTIKIKKGVEHIADGCLYNIDGVKQIYIPSSVEVIGYDNIQGCKDLKRVYIEGKNTTIKPLMQGSEEFKTKYYVKSNAYYTLANLKYDAVYFREDRNYYDISTNWKPDKTKSVSAVGKTKSTAKITWKKQGYVSGYEVYMKTSKNGSWKKVATLKGSDSTSYTQKGLSKNKTYYFRVRAYKTVYDKTYYGAYSSTDTAKTKSK